MEQILHAASPIGPLLTVSLGVGTIMPGANDESRRFNRIEQSMG